MPLHPRIEMNPAVMLGKPVIRGTRIPVELLLRKLSEGATERDLLEGYPRLTPDDLRAALAYAADHEEAFEAMLLRRFEDLRSGAVKGHTAEESLAIVRRGMRRKR
ncbi:MAG: DUF433 domain-containing protein [Planctomycetes bacterium]|nr:DUF433 domain-containing protein [Planctomycetota bacterium]